MFANQARVFSLPSGLNQNGTVVWEVSDTGVNNTVSGAMDRVVGYSTWQPPNHVLFQLAWLNQNGTVVWEVSDTGVNNTVSGAMDRVVGCSTWKPPNHVLFQLACALLAAGLLAFDTPYGALLLHFLFFLGYLLMSVWSWVILCAPDFFSWNFAFLLLNGVQTMSLLYSIRPVRFCRELEDVYTNIFQPLKVPRSLYKRLVGAEYCTLMTLNEGEHYATQSITKTDKLGLLITGTMNAFSNRTLLHTIKAKQFIDSPEFESSNSGDEQFQVSIIAGSVCRYIFWPRQSLEYLLVQEPYLASIINIVLGRDITNKLYALNERVSTVEGSKLDIRLPSVSPSLRARRDIRKAVVGVTVCTGVGGATEALDTLTSPLDPACNDDSDDSDEGFIRMSEKMELLNGHATGSPPGPGGPSPISGSAPRATPPSGHSSPSSRHSGLQFDI